MMNMRKTVHCLAIAVFALTAVVSRAETGLTVDGGVLRFHVDADDTLSWSEAFPADATAFVKTGAGTLEIGSANSSFKGSADIMEGVVKILHKDALGSSTQANRLTDGAISVSNDAQLVTYCDRVNQAGVVISKRLVLSGTGPDGTGALRLGTTTGWANQDCYVSHLVLQGDALVVKTGSCRYGISKTDLQGHELKLDMTDTNSGYIFLNAAHLSAGTIRCCKGTITWQGNQTFAGGAEGRFIVMRGAVLSLYSGATGTVFPWTLEFAGTGTALAAVQVGGSNGTTPWLDTFTGPVEFNATAQFTGNRIVFHGAASGTGQINAFNEGVEFRSGVARMSGVMNVGYTSRPGVLKLSEEAAITNRISVGPAAGRTGGVHLYGGTVRNGADSGNKTSVGSGSGAYGYLGVYGGSYAVTKYSFLGNGSGSSGILEVRDGTVKLDYWHEFNIGTGGSSGEVHMTGGALKMSGGVLGADDKSEGGSATVTLSGSGRPMFHLTGGEEACLRTATNDFVFSMNLNSGEIVASAIKKSNAYAGRMHPSAKAFLNFNGGTFRNVWGSAAIFGTGDTALDRVTVFAGGAKFCATNNFEQTADTPLLRPTGRGIASIALPADLPNGNYSGPPPVCISGGGGEGATAHAVYDPETRSVTGIEVTCPGWNYTDVPAVTVSSPTNRTVVYGCTVTLTGEEQTDGGIHLTGASHRYLKLNAVNTYRGDTVLGGRARLIIAADGALPAESTVVFAGGRMTNSSSVPHLKYAIDCEAAMAAGGFSYDAGIDFAEGSVLDVRNAEDFPREAKETVLLTFTDSVTGMPEFTGISEFQRVRLADRKLMIENIKGTVMILR